MKNKIWFLLIIILAVIISIAIYFGVKSRENNTNSNYDTSRTSTNNENSNNEGNTSNIDDENRKNNENEMKDNNTSKENKENNKPQYKEEQLSTFSTKIYSKDSERQNNINITCNTLNDTIVKNGETFSFCNTVGKATSSKGYEEADVFDHNGNKTKGLRWWKLSSK